MLPAASAGREAPAGDRHREVPRHDDADHAERLVEGDVDAAGHRDLPAEQPLRAPRSSSSGTSRTLPASQRALPMVWPALRDLELRPAPRRASSTTAANRRSSRARSAGRDVAPAPGTPPCARSIAASVSSTRRRASTVGDRLARSPG